MFIKRQRLEREISQENLAETCGLSLRTIQRVESGHRVSYASLRALARVFQIDVDELERELYAMKNITDEFQEIPLWMRLGHGWFTVSRSETVKIEIFLLIMGTISYALYFILPEKPLDFFLFPKTINLMALHAGLGAYLGAYLMSLYLRAGDKYSQWGEVEASQSGGIFGLFKNR